MDNLVKKIVKVIIDILTGIIFIILILVIISKLQMVISGNDYLTIFGKGIFQVATGSMEPTIKENDIIVVEKEDEYNVNDIITYRKENDYITHRIMQINNGNFITKGDANNANDEAINENMIIGKVVNIYHNLAIWKKIFTTPEIVISIFITLMLFDFAFSYNGNIKDVKIALSKKKKTVKETNKNLDNKDVETVKINELQCHDYTDDEKQQILELTQKLDLSSLKAIQEKYHDDLDMPKLKNEEIKSLSNKIKKMQQDDVEMPKLKGKEKDFLEYTMRLDLTELQKHISSKMKK